MTTAVYLGWATTASASRSVIHSFEHREYCLAFRLGTEKRRYGKFPRGPVGGTSRARDPVGAPGPYRFVELGRGRVDLGAVFAALGEISFTGWAIAELDEVTDPARTAKESAELSNRRLKKTRA